MRCLIISLLAAMLSRSVRAFDVRHHLSTKTRYAWKVPIPGAPSIYSTPDPEGYEPLHMWLLARHGTRWPTKGRMEQVGSEGEPIRQPTAFLCFAVYRYRHAD